jgi:hypothetical protein
MNDARAGGLAGFVGCFLVFASVFTPAAAAGRKEQGDGECNAS